MNDQSYVVITKSKEEDLVREEYSAGKWFNVPTKEIVKKMEGILKATRENKNEHMIAVGISGDVSDIIEGSTNEISTDDFERAEASVKDGIQYHVHSHSIDYDKNPSGIDFSSTDPGQVNFVLGYETFIQNKHHYVGGYKSEEIVTEHIVMYNRAGKLYEMKFSDFKKLVSKVNKQRR